MVDTSQIDDALAREAFQTLDEDAVERLHAFGEVRSVAAVDGLHGDTSLAAITLLDNQSGETRRVATTALFLMIGAAPFTDWLDGTCELDDKGFVRSGADCGGASSLYTTSCPGLFVVGDVRSGSVKRVASAVGEGSVVISSIHEWLTEQDASTRALALVVLQLDIEGSSASVCVRDQARWRRHSGAMSSQRNAARGRRQTRPSGASEPLDIKLKDH